MKKGNGFSMVGSIIFVIIILIAILFFAGDKIFGKNGMVDKLKEADNEFNKTEIVDSLNLIIKEKYVLEERYFYGKTQMELSEELGISQAQISRLEKSGLDNIKKKIL